jgi:hypothetical protein
VASIVQWHGSSCHDAYHHACRDRMGCRSVVPLESAGASLLTLAHKWWCALMMLLLWQGETEQAHTDRADTVIPVQVSLATCQTQWELPSEARGMVTHR